MTNRQAWEILVKERNKAYDNGEWDKVDALWIATGMLEVAMSRSEADRCNGCIFDGEPWDTTPCGYCMRSHKDLYVRSEEQ